MKTFSDLEFQPHAVARRASYQSPGAEIAQLRFENGNKVSVIRGCDQFRCGAATYEVAAYRGKNPAEVHGYQDAHAITKLMEGLQR
jgi:hypothetical protein